jgi:uncharacterized DUF497 family protein
MDFEWDTYKAEVNLNKHGVSFFEACEQGKIILFVINKRFFIPIRYK